MADIVNEAIVYDLKINTAGAEQSVLSLEQKLKRVSEGISKARSAMAEGAKVHIELDGKDTTLKALKELEWTYRHLVNSNKGNQLNLIDSKRTETEIKAIIKRFDDLNKKVKQSLQVGNQPIGKSTFYRWRNELESMGKELEGLGHIKTNSLKNYTGYADYFNSAGSSIKVAKDKATEARAELKALKDEYDRLTNRVKRSMLDNATPMSQGTLSSTQAQMSAVIDKLKGQGVSKSNIFDSFIGDNTYEAYLDKCKSIIVAKKQTAKIEKEAEQAQKKVNDAVEAHNNLLDYINKKKQAGIKLSKEEYEVVKKTEAKQLTKIKDNGGTAPAVKVESLDEINKAAYSNYIKNLPTSIDEITSRLGNWHSKISALKSKQQELSDVMSRMPKGSKEFAQASAAYSRAGSEIEILTNKIKQFDNHAVKATSSAELFGLKLKGHFAWIIAGTAVESAIGVPANLIKTIEEVEVHIAGLKQVMGEAEYEASNSINKVNDETLMLIDTAARYGEAVEDIIEAARSWGRMYGSHENSEANVNLLVSQSAKMAVADNFSLESSVKGLESAMSQFGMKSYDTAVIQANTNRILDVWTKIAHTGMASAQDLTEAVRQAGATAHQAGVSFEFFNALVAAGVRNTAKSGNEIGTALKSMFVSIHSSKAVKEIEKLGVSVYQVGEDGTKSYRNVEDVLMDLAVKVQTTTKDTEALNLALGGGKYQVSKVTAIIKDYEEIITAMNNAVNSQGFTDEQVGVQLDTLARKSQTVKDNISGMFVEIGQAGALEGMKTATTALNDLITGMRQHGSAIAYTAAAIGGLVGLIILLKNATNAMKVAYGAANAEETAMRLYNLGTMKEEITTDLVLADMKSRGIQASYNVGVAKGLEAAKSRMVANQLDVEIVKKNQLALANRTVAATTGSVAAANVTMTGTATAAAGATTVLGGAITRLGISMRALLALFGGWWGLAFVGLSTLAAHFISVGQEANEAKNQVDAFKESTDKFSQNQEQELARLAQRQDFIKKLIENYNMLGESLNNLSEGDEKRNELINNRNATMKILTEQYGLNSEEVQKNGKITEEMTKKILEGNIKSTKDDLKAKTEKWQSELEADKAFVTAYAERMKCYALEVTKIKDTGDWIDSLTLKWNQFKLSGAQKSLEMLEKMSDEEYAMNSITGMTRQQDIELTKAAMAEAQSNINKIDEDNDNVGLPKEKEEEYNKYKNDMEKAIAEKQEAINKSLSIQAQLDVDKLDLYSEKAHKDATAGNLDEEEEKAKKKSAQGKSKSDPIEDVPTSSWGELALEAARDQLGTPYLLGAGGAYVDGMTDCGKMVQDAFNKAGIAFENRRVDYMIDEAQEKGAWHKYGDGYEPKAGDAVVVKGGEHIVMADGTGRYVGASSDTYGKVIQSNGTIEQSFGTPTGYIDVNALAGGGAPSNKQAEAFYKHISNGIKIAKQQDFDKLTISANKYSAAMEKLESYSKLYGTTAEYLNGVDQTRLGRIQELNAEADMMGDGIENLEARLEGLINKDNKLMNELHITEADWNKKDAKGNIDKQNRHNLVIQSKDAISNNNRLKEISDVLVEYRKKKVELDAARSKLISEALEDKFAGVANKETRANWTVENIKAQKELALAQVDPYQASYADEVYQIEGEAAQRLVDQYRIIYEEKQRLYEQTQTPEYIENNVKLIEAQIENLKKLKEQGKATNDEINKAEQLLASARVGRSKEAHENWVAMTNAEKEYEQAVQEAKEKTAQYSETIRSQMADVFDSLIVQGNSFRDVWDNLWKGLASDAIKQLLHLKNDSGGLLENLITRKSRTKTTQNMGGYSQSFADANSNAGSTDFLNATTIMTGALGENAATTNALTAIGSLLQVQEAQHQVAEATQNVSMMTSMEMLIWALNENTMALNQSSLTGGEDGGFNGMGGWIGSLFKGHATGGSLQGLATGGAVKSQKAGKVRGAGTGTSDSILTYMQNLGKFVMLSDGEFVVNAKSTRQNLPILEAINAGKFAEGGAITLPKPEPMIPTLSNPKLNNVSTTINSANNARMENLLSKNNNVMQHQNSILSDIRDNGGSSGGGGSIVVLNTQADSASIMKAIQKNPRVIQAILSRNKGMGFK